MPDITFLVNVEPPEIRVAEVRDGRLFDLDVERDNRMLGDIYLGQVENIIPGMDAAFVDIGTRRNALIYVGDVDTSTGAAEKAATLPIEKMLRPGQLIVVQVARPAVGTKGARVTARLSLPGRYTVLAASSDSIGVSRRIENSEERERLRRIAERARPLDHGVIVRTEAEGVGTDELAADITFLHRQLERIKERAQGLTKPMRLHRDLGALGRLARDRLNDTVDKIVIDAPEEYEAFLTLVETIAPRYTERVHLHSSGEPLFNQFQISRDIKRAFERTVPLPHGGSLVIDEAEAFCAIDVNTGKFTGKNRLADTVLKTNLEAVEEAARQLRLRNIGGVIVIDFIDMERTRDRIKVMNALEVALKADRTRTRIVQLSPLGLVEMTRRREGDSLRQMLHRPCPYCSGDGVIKTSMTIAIEARRQIRALAEELKDTPDRAVGVTLHPETALVFLGEGGEWARDLEATSGTPLFLKVDFALHVETILVEKSTKSEFEANRSQVTFGSRLYLQEEEFLSDVTGGRSQGDTAEWAAVSNMLLHLEQGAVALTGRPSVVEIVEIGNWFHRARVLTSVDPRDE
jgi:ribonuclease G